MSIIQIACSQAGKPFVLILILLWILGSCLSAQSQEINVDKLDQLFSHITEQDEAMGNIMILKNGESIYSKTIGYRYYDDRKKILSDIDTKYRIWSVTKMYTATMILQEVEEGKISLDTRLDRFYPNIQNAEAITIQQMLNHTSGIHDFTDPNTDSLPEAVEKTRDVMANLIASFKPVFSPGEKFQYSNSNYLLLGYVLEKLDSASYGEILSQRISSRAGLNDTYFGRGSLDQVENKAFSYKKEGNQWVAVDEGEFSGLIPAGAGGIVSTPADMIKFITALFAEKLISKNNLTKMTDEHYGLGMMSMPFKEHEAYGHTGGYLASNAILVYFPAEKLAIAYCTNGQTYSLGNTIDQVLNIYFDQSYELPQAKKEIKLSETILYQYVGKYRTPKFLLTIAMEDGYLTAQPEGQPKSILFAKDETRFFLKEINIEIKFNIDEAGNVMGLMIFQGGDQIQAIKLNE